MNKNPLAHASAIAASIVVLMHAAFAAAAPVRTGHVTAELVAEQQALVPGTTTTVALRLALDPGWHTYWRNPGESGLPTTLDWTLPPGFSAGAIAWPPPRTLPAGPLVNYGYEGTVLHLVTLTVPAAAQPGTQATLAARADWLVCKETCIPEGADLTLTLPVAAQAVPDARWQPQIAATRDALPRPAPAGWDVQAVASGSTITLRLPAGADSPPKQLHFFADAEHQIEPSAPQPVARMGDRLELQLPVSHELKPGLSRLTGVVTAEPGLSIGGRLVNAVAIDTPLDGRATAGPKPVERAPVNALVADASRPAVLSLPIALALALGGGLLLNLMPCVFPILSLKALALVGPQSGNRAAMRREGVAFAAGVIVAFVAFALALAGLRTAGEQLGWGFQLQSPAVVATLALLFFVMALNLSGLFEFGSLLPSSIASWSHGNRNVNAFASGLLAVAVASPCTAPFMGAALGYALSQSAQLTLAVFVALGIGMALPYVALAWFPAWRRMLPRPGGWMVTLKQVLAFPLYATVAWLVWVLGAQVGNDAVFRIGIALVLVAFALWSWRKAAGVARVGWTVAAIAGALAGVAVAWPVVVDSGHALDTDAARPGSVADGWAPYSAQRVAELVDARRPVFVDFTAAWCVTCQVNKRLVLTDASVRAAFARADVALLRADWTRRDPAITQALASLDRSGVPVYVLYRAGKPPLLLPEVLSRQGVIDAIAGS